MSEGKPNSESPGSPLQRYQGHVLVVLAALLAAAVVFIAIDRSGDPTPLEIAFDAATPGGPIEVYVTGAVDRPGVYEIVDGDRVVDAIAAAGGFAPDANPEAINLAIRLHDEDQVVVPRLGQPVSDVAGIVSGDALNINSATAAELDDKLPGIGEVYSQRIVDSRTAVGPFTSITDLVTRNLIPQATYERIRELISVGP